MFNEKMQPCCKFALMPMMMVMVLMVVVIKADISATQATKDQKLDSKCLQNIDESEMKICATNGTDFVSFPNECRLREVNRNKGITAFKKVTSSSCGSSTSESKSTKNHPAVETIDKQSKLSNKPKPTIMPSTLSVTYNVSPTTNRSKTENEFVTATTSATLRTVDKITSTIMRMKKVDEYTTAATIPKIYNKKALTSIPTITTPISKIITITNPAILPIHEFVSSTIRSTAKPGKSVIPANEIIRPVNERKPNNIHQKNEYKEEVSPIFQNTKKDNEITIVLETNTIRPVENAVAINFPIKITPVNKYPKVNTIPSETITTIPPMPAKAETRNIISCPYIFNPVCATHDGIQATFINECMVNAEKVRTGKDWTIYRNGICNEDETEHTNHQEKVSAGNDSYANSPMELKLEGDNIVFASYSYPGKHLPCTKMFNPVCAIFAGVKSTFINECLVNAENIKTGTAWKVFSRGVCAEDYASTLNENKLGALSTRSNVKKSYEADQPEPVKEEHEPNIILITPTFQTEIIEGPFSEQQILEKTNIHSPSLPGQIIFEPAKEYASPLLTESRYDSSNAYNQPTLGEQFKISKEYTAPFLAINSYSPLLSEGKKFEVASQYAPFGRVLPNLKISAQYDASVSDVDSRNNLQPFESVNSYALRNSKDPIKYTPLSSAEEIEPQCRPSAKRKPIDVVDEKLPIDKVSLCNFGVAQLPVCAIYKNKRRSFDTICELKLRNTIKNETWTPLYDGRCKCPEVCTLGIEPICVSRNGIMETIPNLCYYERLKIQDPFNSWQYISEGECFLSPLNSAFKHLAKPADPLTIRVPDYENTNSASTNLRQLVNPLSINANYREISHPVLKNPREFRGYREIKKSNYDAFESQPTSTSKTTSRESTVGTITAASSSTTATVITSTSSNPNYPTTTARPSDQTTTLNGITATETTGKIVPFKKPLTRFVVSARKPTRTSIYGSNPKSVIMRLIKRRAFSAADSKSARSLRKDTDH